MPRSTTDQDNTLSAVSILRLTKPGTPGRMVENSWGAFRVFVPSNAGGFLRVKIEVPLDFDQPGAKLRIISADQKHHDVFLKPDQQEGSKTVEVNAGQRDRNYTIIVNAERSWFRVSAEYYEHGVARNEDGSAAIPWNFWYFPYSIEDSERTAYASSALRPFQKYEKAFGRERVLEWERTFHADLAAKYEAWEGHCHNAAPASIMFEAPPADGKVHNGIHFTCEELKLLATEFAGTHKGYTDEWYLGGGKAADAALVNSRPSEDPETFGPSLVSLLEFLRTHLRTRGFALHMELRDERGQAAKEKWNHAVYEYKMPLWQDDPNDHRLVQGMLELRANLDHLNDDFSSSGFPAKPTLKFGHAWTKDGTPELRRLEFQLRFLESGRVSRASPENRWTDISTILWDDDARKSRVVRGLFAPRLALKLSAPAATMQPVSSIHDGNRAVVGKDVLALLDLKPKYGGKTK